MSKSKDRQYYESKINEALEKAFITPGFRPDFLFKMKARLDFRQELTPAQFAALDNIFAFLFEGKKLDKSDWIRIDKSTGEIK